MKIDVQRSGGAAVVVVGGRLTLSTAGRLRQALADAFDGASRVDLFLHDVQEADLSFVQLLCAAQRTSAAGGAAFAVSGFYSSEPVSMLLLSAGAERGEGCSGRCPWEGFEAQGPCPEPTGTEA